MKQLKISKLSFWDIDFEKLDEEKNSQFIIQRIMEYGLFEEILSIIRFYGKKRVSEEIRNASWLGKKTLSFCCVLFHLKPTDFKCYTKKQLNQELWNY